MACWIVSNSSLSLISDSGLPEDAVPSGASSFAGLSEEAPVSALVTTTVPSGAMSAR